MYWRHERTLAVAAVAVLTVWAAGCAGEDAGSAGEEAESVQEEAGAAQEEAGAAQRDPAGWRVQIDVDGPLDTMRNALSPMANAPGALANADGDFDSWIRYLCLNAEERAMGSLAPVMFLFRRSPQPAAPAGGVTGRMTPVELRTVWGEETVAFGATHYAGRDRISLSLEDGAERSGESSHEEFLGRLLEGSWTATDSVVVELEWEGAGPVRYAYSLEGAAAAIREAGGPCGVG